MASDFIDEADEYSDEHSGDGDDEGMGNDVATVTQTLSNIREKPPKPVRKTNAMGEYIPPEGGKPLTQLAIPLPGAADYSPSISLTKPSAAQYSIVGKPKDTSSDNFPGPNKYRTEGDMVWRDRGFPLIGKGKPENHSTCTRGPAAYMSEHQNIGTGGNPKWTIGGKTKIMTGPPDSRVQPVDAHGFKTPAPDAYRPNSSHWRKNIKKSFGLSLKNNEEPVQTPGPAEYACRYEDRGPAYSLAKRLPVSSSDNNPGPAAYDLGTTIGKAVAKSITSRQPEISSVWAPSPNTYGVLSRLGEGPKHSMTYREFERKVSPKPSPANYKPNLNNLPKDPNYSCRKLCRPIYPDILNYAEHSLMKNNKVGPGTYDSHKNFSDNDKPAYSMKKRLDPNISETPGPASYDIKQTARPDAKRAAAFSMGNRIETKSTSFGPGPAAYYPKVKTSAAQYSMSSRNKKATSSTTPAPNSYRIKSGQNNRGISNGPSATLKGRPSPFVYSGLKQILTN